MITSRSLDDLAPFVKVKALDHIKRCRDAGIDLLIYCTYRDTEAQNELYKHGRTISGAVLTFAKGGDSWHQWRVAYDCVPVRNGKPIWTQNNDADRLLWERVGAIGEACGLQWSGRWTGAMREMAHFEDTKGLTIAQIKKIGGFV